MWKERLKQARDLRQCRDNDDDDDKSRKWCDLWMHYETEWATLIETYANTCLPEGKIADKVITLSARQALQFANLCLASATRDARERIQNRIAGSGTHDTKGSVSSMKALAQILACSNPMDGKCRRWTGQLWCNIVTDNAHVSTQVLKSFPLQPPEHLIRLRMQQELDLTSSSASEQSPICCLDMVRACGATDRTALAPIVASVHNTLAAIQSRHDQEVQVFLQSSLFLCLLLRLAIPNPLSLNANTDGDDPAAEWIALFFARLRREFGLRAVYQAIGDDTHVLPEHLVLLKCVHSDLVSSVPITFSDVSFLVDVYGQLCTRSKDEAPDCNESQQLVHALALHVVETMSDVLEHETNAAKQLRQELGPSMMPLVLKHLGRCLDDLSAQHEAKAVRDIRVDGNNRQWLIAMVCWIGSMCFQCRDNQDLLRTTLVPATSTGVGRCDDNAVRLLSDRTGLHVLLSTTAWSSCCWGLREWAVVAIRYALHGNVDNQQLVANLEAQRPVQSAVLQDLGITVALDDKGKVSVAPVLDKIDE